MPSVKPGESEKDYVSRCIPVVLREGTAKDQQQAAAICYSMYERSSKKELTASIAEMIVAAIKIGIDKGYTKKSPIEEAVSKIIKGE